MDLLASYGGSDDEEEAEVVVTDSVCPVAAPAPSISWLLSSLPRPQQGRNSDDERPRLGITGTLPPPRNSLSTPGCTIDLAGDGGSEDDLLSGELEMGGASVPGTRLSAVLPRPKGSAGVGASAPQKRKIVEFKPPVNAALLQMDEEEERRPAKRKSSAGVGSGNKLGLAAMLPPPKHTLGAGAALGGGFGAGGRRTIMETHAPVELQPVTPVAEANIVEQPLFHAQASVSGYEEESYNAEESWQYEESHGGPHQEHAVCTPQLHLPPPPEDDPLARLLQFERRRGKKEAPTVIEIKQSDLTGGKQHPKITAPAFGPAYQPPSTGKPSKILRRKHQIGSLYYDMRQKELELNDRRARGQLTKAETHAKYGW